MYQVEGEESHLGGSLTVENDLTNNTSIIELSDFVDRQHTIMVQIHIYLKIYF